MLRNYVASKVNQSLSRLGFAFGVKPTVGNLYINLAVRVYGVSAHCKSVNAARYLGVVLSHGCHIAKLVALCLKSGSNTRQISCLIDSAEIIIEVYAV